METHSLDPNGSQPLWRSALDVLATVAMIAAAGVLLWNHVYGTPSPSNAAPSTPSAPVGPVSIAGAATLGAHDARVVLLEFSDFQCPFCGQFARDTMPLVRREYVDTGRVRIVFRNLPLAIHEHAKQAAIYAECAARQGRFWPMHDKLFSNGSELDDTHLMTYATAAGLDITLSHTCIAGRDAATAVDTDVAIARQLGLTGTPTFFVGVATGERDMHVTDVLRGAMPLATFEAAFAKAQAEITSMS
jgi:protein-disulfide isomerase